MNSRKSIKEQGFTIIELMVAMAISLVVMAAVFSTFKSQQDSYVVQSEVSVTQQNLRAALFMISRDIKMAGYYTNFIKGSYTFHSSDPIMENVTIRPVLYSRDNNEDSIAGVKDDTDVLVIIKGNEKTPYPLAAGEYATPGDSATADLYFADKDDALDQLELDEFPGGHNKYGLLVKKDMNRAELFEVKSDKTFEFPAGLVDNYGAGDMVVKVDVIIYKIDDTGSGPTLKRKNLGTDAQYSTIAENVDNLQFLYLKRDGSEIDNLDDASNIPLVRAVKVFILAKTDKQIRGYTDPHTYQVGNMTVDPLNDDSKYMRRLLSATINTRNIGL
jgi:prepilin-type N-terminal cleavage/methylation domain-containing protein